MADTNPINYAAQYAEALANAFPTALYFGALYGTPNNQLYRMGEDGKTVYIPRIDTTGRTNGDRDNISLAVRNYHNTWEPKTLTRERIWQTLVHPKDVDQTRQVASIQNITQTFNVSQKFPEMNAYMVYQLYKLWTSTDPTDSEKTAKTPDTRELTTANILTVFDDAMTAMDEANVPPDGRILYCTPPVKRMFENADKISKSINVTNASSQKTVNRVISRLDEVTLVKVPSKLMMTDYDFSVGWAPKQTAAQVNFLLVHPDAVIAPVSYSFAQLSPPDALSQGKWVYYEESHEDVFIINRRQDAIFFSIVSP